MRIGLDVGSTTIKAVVVGNDGNILYQSYERHLSRVRERAAQLLRAIVEQLPQAKTAKLAISGSAGMGLAESLNVPFAQEVHATRVCVEQRIPGADVVIELGGEDAKIIFLKGMTDARMNGSCAGGTGAFIDQMATLMNVSPTELNELAKGYERIYTIASRCGVFAKSDIQPLINQGAKEQDIAASIFSAVVNQTIAGLAQGRPIRGNVIYLGGPLTFLSELRNSFDRGLNLKGLCPEHSLYFVALGAAYLAGEEVDVSALIAALDDPARAQSFAFMPPLFESQAQYDEFSRRHSQAKVARGDLKQTTGPVFLGIDAGSTTIKFALIDEEGRLLSSQYRSNSGNPVPLVKEYLEALYTENPGLVIAKSAVTGYGEDLIRNAFSLDCGLVETMAHFTAAKKIQPEVDFIIDIGGQDMKCLKIHNNAIDNIYLNEACSSGCGSFLQTFAGAINEDIADFAKRGLFADRPVDLGSRCTVFMNSSVKQAQKEGASAENISAGLSISVVKNAIYKVIRPSSTQALGKHVVVQGGTFYNDAVLRAFEKELGLEVTRADIAGLMGAYGAALFAEERYRKNAAPSTTLQLEGLKDFVHEVRSANCGRCENNCRLTINRFSGGRSFISGNRCELPVTKVKPDDSMNLYRHKLSLLLDYEKKNKGNRRKIGLPFGLNIYELLPFWQAFFDVLGCDVVLSPVSDRKLYLSGQGTIPSDTVCFPAKLMHGHVQALIDAGIETIFYPCMSYNIDENSSDNCYNCPVVAYYPEVLSANMHSLEKVQFLHGFVGIHKRKYMPEKMYEMLLPHFDGLTKAQAKQAVDAGFLAYDQYLRAVESEGARIIEKARKEGRPIIVLAGRPYHVDPEINHGIDQMLTGMGAAVVSEDALPRPQKVQRRTVLNQWTYHSRLYAAAEQVATQADMQFVQLVSFGCGCDAITTDECRSILENKGKIYTQLKIDEIENLGAAKIRLRSLFAATGLDEGEGK